MGTHVNYEGAIRITPMLDKAQMKRFNDFFDIRHMRRDVEALNTLYSTLEGRKSVTLMGDGNFGPEGIFFLPKETGDVEYQTEPAQVEGLNIPRDCSTTPAGCPSLYCGLVIVPSEDEGCSYLGWDQSPEAAELAEWIRLVAERLVPLGYHLDGEMFGNIGDGCEFRTIMVKDAEIDEEELVPPATYDFEFHDARSRAGMD